MCKEKMKIRFHRWFWFIILALCILAPIVAYNLPDNSEMEMKRARLEVISYRENQNETYCKVDCTFNMDVDLESVTLIFFDENEFVLERRTESFYKVEESNKKFSKTFYVEGKVDECEIVDFVATPLEDDLDRELALIDLRLIVLMTSIILGSVAFGLFIGALSLSYKKYKLKGKDLIIYAGFCHHYIEYDGVLMDEYNTFISFTPIHLSCTLNDGTHLNATISLSNRIALKINDQLYRGKKK